VQAIQLDHFGVDHLRLIERPLPEPGPRQVLVRMRAASVNFRDCLIVQGQYRRDLPLPLTPLSDGAGEVEAVGAGVTTLAPGDRVSSVFFQQWADGPASADKIAISTGCEAPGVLAEYAVLPQEAVLPVPAALSFAEAAALPCAGVTAWHALALGRCGPGRTVLVLGTGGVAVCALQFALAMGARVIVTSGSDDKLARAAALGADAGINYRRDPEWGRTAFAIAGRGVDLVVETAGAGTLGQSLAALGWDGHIACLGTLTGLSTELSLLPILRKSGHLHGITVGSRAHHQELLDFVASRGIRPVVEERSGLRGGPAAIRDIVGGGHFGKVVVRID
jgi:NADPH:quinone reductase-like Zn-dependent oxidoreductase